MPTRLEKNHKKSHTRNGVWASFSCNLLVSNRFPFVIVLNKQGLPITIKETSNNFTLIKCGKEY